MRVVGETLPIATKTLYTRGTSSLDSETWCGIKTSSQQTRGNKELSGDELPSNTVTRGSGT